MEVIGGMQAGEPRAFRGNGQFQQMRWRELLMRSVVTE
jgi:hypothetical protein